MKPLRTAILGCGGIAQRHARNMTALDEKFRLVAFGDVSPERARAFSEQFTAGEAPVFADHQALFEQCELDAVVICLPPFAHSDEVEAAAAHGVHVLIEKPIALEAEHAWRMVAAAERAGIVTQVGFMYRFGAAIGRLKQMIASGAAGQAGLMSARYFCNHLHAEWWRERDKSGGQLVEQVIHMVDLMRYLMGEADTVYSVQRNLYHGDVPRYSVEDVSGTVFSFRSGGIGVIYASNNAIPGRWINDYKVVTAAVTAEFADANHALFTHTKTPDLQTEVIASEQDVYVTELLDFHDAIRAGRPALIPIREGARSLELALAARLSAETGEVVRV
jgi:predicted dehydrogenase